MRFSNGREMYNYISAGNDLYCEECTTYVFSYNDLGSICVYYRVNADKAAELAELSREHDEYWGAFLGATANQIFDSAEYMREVMQLSECEDEALSWCNEQFGRDWTDTKEYGKKIGVGKVSQYMSIRGKGDLKNAYILLKGFEQLIKSSEKKQGNAECILIQIKKAIRSHYKGEMAKPERRLVKEYGIDGYIVLMELPEFLKTVEEAKQYFEKERVIICRPSIFDCTGQFFTISYKIVERQGRLWAYHHVGCDV